jgi:hypothetical protein
VQVGDLVMTSVSENNYVKGKVLAIFDKQFVLRIDNKLIEVAADAVALPLAVVRTREQEKFSSMSRKTNMQAIALCEVVAFPSELNTRAGDRGREMTMALSTLIEVTKEVGTVAAAVGLANRIVRHPHVFKMQHVQAFLERGLTQVTIAGMIVTSVCSCSSHSTN